MNASFPILTRLHLNSTLESQNISLKGTHSEATCLPFVKDNNDSSIERVDGLSFVRAKLQGTPLEFIDEKQSNRSYRTLLFHLFLNSEDVRIVVEIETKNKKDDHNESATIIRYTIASECEPMQSTYRRDFTLKRGKRVKFVCSCEGGEAKTIVEIFTHSQVALVLDLQKLIQKRTNGYKLKRIQVDGGIQVLSVFASTGWLSLTEQTDIVEVAEISVTSSLNDTSIYFDNGVDKLGDILKRNKLDFEGNSDRQANTSTPRRRWKREEIPPSRSINNNDVYYMREAASAYNLSQDRYSSSQLVPLEEKNILRKRATTTVSVDVGKIYPSSETKERDSYKSVLSTRCTSIQSRSASSSIQRESFPRRSNTSTSWLRGGCFSQQKDKRAETSKQLLHLSAERFSSSTKKDKLSYLPLQSIRNRRLQFNKQIDRLHSIQNYQENQREESFQIEAKQITLSSSSKKTRYSPHSFLRRIDSSDRCTKTSFQEITRVNQQLGQNVSTPPRRKMIIQNEDIESKPDNNLVSINFKALNKPGQEVSSNAQLLIELTVSQSIPVSPSPPQIKILEAEEYMKKALRFTSSFRFCTGQLAVLNSITDTSFQPLNSFENIEQPVKNLSITKTSQFSEIEENIEFKSISLFSASEEDFLGRFSGSHRAASRQGQRMKYQMVDDDTFSLCESIELASK